MQDSLVLNDDVEVALVIKVRLYTAWRPVPLFIYYLHFTSCRIVTLGSSSTYERIIHS